jgi:hypothetical protein
MGMCFVLDKGKVMEDNKDKKTDNDNNYEKLKGSKSDPQKTEMEGLKRGGVEPKVHEEDRPKDEKGRTER